MFEKALRNGFGLDIGYAFTTLTLLWTDSLWAPAVAFAAWYGNVKLFGWIGWRECLRNPTDDFHG